MGIWYDYTLTRPGSRPRSGGLFRLADDDLGSQKLQLLSRNAQQLLKIVQSTFPSASFDTNAFADCDLDKLSGIEEVQCAWSQAQKLLSDKQVSSSEDEVTISTIETALLRFSRIAQEVMSSTASNYDMTRLCAGVFILAIAASILVPTIYSEFSATLATGLFIMFMVTGYGSMMFASSYVEEEQQFWYWICSGWIFYLHIRSESSSRKTRVRSSSGSSSSLNSFWLLKIATLVLFITHRFLRRWNQTGQKFTAEPDIAKGFFPSYPGILWGLVILTYADSGYHFFKKIPSTVLATLLALTLPPLAFLFKLNFVTNDSPELLVDNPLSNIAGNWILGGLSLVWQAKLVFFGLAGCAIWSIVSKTQTQSKSARPAHPLLSSPQYHTLTPTLLQNQTPSSTKQSTSS